LWAGSPKGCQSLFDKVPTERKNQHMKTTVLTITAVVALAYAARAQNEFGLAAGNTTLTGTNNTGIGFDALGHISSGSANTASGHFALTSNTSGSESTATGAWALYANTSGYYNTASGYAALENNTNGYFNTANGYGALYANRSGYYNTADGYSALENNTTGNANIALGGSAGVNLTTGDNNIDIGNEGVAGEAATIRIGTSGTHTNTFIAGISGVSLAGGAVVVVSAEGQLGTTNMTALTGPQGPAGSGLVQGAYLTLPVGTAAPPGFTMLGTTRIRYKAGTKHKTIVVDLYQKD